MYRFLLTTFLLNSILLLSAQEPSFIHYGVDEGLPSNLIYSMTQDKEGFLWMGTDKGLARFDGLRFHVFDMHDGLPDPEILNIEADSKGRLWISPFRQNPCFWEDGVFHTAKTDSFLQKIQLQSASFDFQEDDSGRIWIFGGERDAYCLDGKRGQKIRFSQTPRRFFQAGAQEYIITLGLITTLKDLQPHDVSIDLHAYLDQTKFQSLSGVGILNNTILICITNKLILLNYINGKFVVRDTLSDFVGQVYATRSGGFALTTFNQGVIFFDCSQGRIIQQERILVGKKVNMIFEDKQGILWFCTPDEGVYGLPRNTPYHYVSDFSPNSHNITSLSIGSHNEIIAGNDEGNLLKLKNGRIESIDLGSLDGANRILKTIPLEDGSIIVASDENIISVDHKITIFPYISTPKSIVYSGDKLWAALSKHLGYYHGSEHDFVSKVADKRFTSIEVDHEGQIWAGGMDGMYGSQDSFSRNWGETFPDLKTRIITILKADPGYLWVSTPSEGLLKLVASGGRITAVDRINGHLTDPIHNVKALYTDKHNHLWLGTNKGVYMLRENFSTIHFDKHDGLVDDDINALVVQEDTLWAGTSKGLSKMLLGTHQQDATFPTFVAGITYRLNEQVIKQPFLSHFDQVRHVVIPPEAGSLEVQLAGLDYSSRGNIQFEYIQQENLPSLQWLTISNIFSLLFRPDKQEKATISTHTLSLGTRLRPGKYTFRFTALNARGEKSTFPDTLVVTQTPFWYETAWFWLGIWLLVFFIFRKIYRDRMAYRDLTASVSKLRLQALQAQMNPHFIGNSIYAIQQFFYPPDPEKASEYIELFNRLLRQTMLMSERHFVLFSEDLNYYQDYLNMIQLRFGNRFCYTITGAETIASSTPFPAMILQPIIENATIHGFAPDGISRLKISFEKVGPLIQCVIEDNGEGIHVTQERKKSGGVKRQSKGLELLHQKIHTLNRLYPVHIQLEIKDLSTIDPTLRGTRVTLSCDPREIKHPEIQNENIV